MASRSVQLRMNHPVIITALILTIIAFMYFAAEVLRPLALAVLLSLVLAPMAVWLERRGLPRAAASGLSVLLVLGTLGGVGYIVYRQFTQLAEEVVDHSDDIKAKMEDLFQGREPTAVGKVSQVFEEVTRDVITDEGAEPGTGQDPDVEVAEAPTPSEADPFEPNRRTMQGEAIIPVDVVDRPTIQDRFSSAVGPILEPAAIFSLVLVLALFILLTRDNLHARLIQVIGTTHVSLTTRTLEEAGRRISHYLMIFSAYNAAYGIIVGLGLYLIGVPYAVLWGFLAAVLRYIPYIGPWTAFALPFAYSVALGEDWQEPLLVLGLFATLEVISNSILEPIIYGRTAGITAVGLLVMAMFWTWLWGPVGLLLSTPLTVCLAVLGKYVPGLNFFATMLGEDVILEPHAQYYQRLLGRDSDGAIEVVESFLDEGQPIEAAFDSILIPSLSRAESDLARSVIEEADQSYLWEATRSILDNLEARTAEELDAGKLRPPAADGARVIGIASNDSADAMVLRMVAMALKSDGIPLEIVTEGASPLEASASVSENAPQIILLSHLPPVGLTSARYKVRRIKALYPDVPLWAGRWGESGSEKARDRLTKMGADRVVLSVADARAGIPEALSEARSRRGRSTKAKAAR